MRGMRGWKANNMWWENEKKGTKERRPWRRYSLFISSLPTVSEFEQLESENCQKTEFSWVWIISWSLVHADCWAAAGRSFAVSLVAFGQKFTSLRFHMNHSRKGFLTELLVGKKNFFHMWRGTETLKTSVSISNQWKESGGRAKPASNRSRISYLSWLVSKNNPTMLWILRGSDENRLCKLCFTFNPQYDKVPQQNV